MPRDAQQLTIFFSNFIYATLASIQCKYLGVSTFKWKKVKKEAGR